MKSENSRAIQLTDRIVKLIAEKRELNSNFFLAISGGSSPLELFKLWRGSYKDIIDWSRVMLFWVDERAVPPQSTESNFGNAKRELLDHIPILHSNVFRIVGENDPYIESLRYCELVKKNSDYLSTGRLFDMVILGIGEDGHTASIFPGDKSMFESENLYKNSINPYSLQDRVSMTINAIELSDNVVFYIKGESKREIIDKILKSNTSQDGFKFPASKIVSKVGVTNIYWDL